MILLSNLPSLDGLNDDIFESTFQDDKYLGLLTPFQSSGSQSNVFEFNDEFKYMPNNSSNFLTNDYYPTPYLSDQDFFASPYDESLKSSVNYYQSEIPIEYNQLATPIDSWKTTTPVVDPRFPMQTTFQYDNTPSMRTCFMNSANAEIYQNPVQDGMMEPINPNNSSFKDNINLKLKLGNDYDSIISKLNQTQDKNDNLNISPLPSKKRNKIFELRCTGKPKANDITKSIEIATKAIMNTNTHEMITPESMITSQTISPLSPENHNHHNMERPFPYPNLFEILQTKFSKEYVKLVNTESCDSVCVECDIQFENYWDYAKHSQCHTLLPERGYHCPVSSCPLSVLGFSKKVSLLHHAYSSHFHRGVVLPNFEQWEHELKEILFNCEVESCGKTFSRNDSLARHNKVIHGVHQDVLYPIKKNTRKRLGIK